LRKYVFQHSRAQLHTTNGMLDILSEHFHEQVLPNQFSACLRYGWSLIVYSPNFNPCDFFLRGLLKDIVYRNNSDTVQKLK